jgi:ribosomal protein S18 acetylase RimI-like enzyme
MKCRMEYEILKLSPDMAEEYVRFFDVTPHDDGLDENKCYCVNWVLGDGDGLETHTADRRRKAALKYVKEGKLRGYLARANGKIIGWLNANEKNGCINCPGWRWFMDGIPVNDGERALSIFCFVIAPDYQRQGVATRLLERAISDAGAEGFDCVEAYPNTEFMSAAMDFRGPKAMYEKLGFEKSLDVNGMTVMRKKLN